MDPKKLWDTKHQNARRLNALEFLLVKNWEKYALAEIHYKVSSTKVEKFYLCSWLTTTFFPVWRELWGKFPLFFCSRHNVILGRIKRKLSEYEERAFEDKKRLDFNEKRQVWYLEKLDRMEIHFLKQRLRTVDSIVMQTASWWWPFVTAEKP